MTLTEIVTLVEHKLGDQTTFYTDAEIVDQGINPAQRLMCLAYPALNTVRTAVTVTSDTPFIDLRTLLDLSLNIIGNRFRHIHRVSLGNVTDDIATPTAATGELERLEPTSIKRLAGRNDWMSLRGEVRRYWMWGRYWLGIYKRPIASTTLTIIYRAAPAPLALASPTGVPDIPAVYHPVIAEIATGMLILKEGDPQTTRGMARIGMGLNLLNQNPIAQGVPVDNARQ